MLGFSIQTGSKVDIVQENDLQNAMGFVGFISEEILYIR